MAAWNLLVQVFLLGVLFFFDDLISIPSCKISGGGTGGGSDSSDDLKMMMVADLMLKGSDANLVDLFFRDYYISKFLKKSLEKVKPDMLLVLGDISSKGSELTVNKWSTIMQQFHGMLGPFVGSPLHIVLGDRDIGECSKLDRKILSQIASSLPGLDTAGCGAFGISNVKFVSLNVVALLCNNNDLRFGVEKVIESERLDIQNQMEHASGETRVSKGEKEDFNNLPWIENGVELGSGPVLLLHFPLYRMPGGKLWYSDVSGDIPFQGARNIGNSVGPYHQMQTLPPNATEYIFYSLKPRMVFSAHTHIFCDYSHRDGLREVTVPAMTWAGKGKPGLVVASFGPNKLVTVTHCSFAKESYVIIAYALLLAMLISTTVLERWSYTYKPQREILI